MLTIVSTYQVRAGNTLSGIATNLGVTLADLLEVNPQIDHPDLIQVGQTLNVPGAPAAAPAPAPGSAVVYNGTDPAPGTVSTQRAQYVYPPLTNAPGSRSAATYAQVIDQFAVGNNPRYTPDGNTYCNIFLWDVSRAMGAEIPHWIDDDGDIETPGAEDAYEVNINGGVDWMLVHGVGTQGWNAATAQQAQDAANLGQIAVVMWKNPTGGHGHTAVIRPGAVTSLGPSSAQAGATNFNVGHVANGFGSIVSGLLYFSHA